MCVSVHVLKTFLFSLGMMGNFCFLQVPPFLVRKFYCFNNESYLLEIFKISFVLTELCLCIVLNHELSFLEQLHNSIHPYYGKTWSKSHVSKHNQGLMKLAKDYKFEFQSKKGTFENRIFGLLNQFSFFSFCWLAILGWVKWVITQLKGGLTFLLSWHFTRTSLTAFNH